jgi:hypothetical protein
MNAMSYYYTKFLKKTFINKCPIHIFMNDFFEFYYGYEQVWIYF